MDDPRAETPAVSNACGGYPPRIPLDTGGIRRTRIVHFEIFGFGLEIQGTRPISQFFQEENQLKATFDPTAASVSLSLTCRKFLLRFPDASFVSVAADAFASRFP